MYFNVKLLTSGSHIAHAVRAQIRELHYSFSTVFDCCGFSSLRLRPIARLGHANKHIHPSELLVLSVIIVISWMARCMKRRWTVVGLLLCVLVFALAPSRNRSVTPAHVFSSNPLTSATPAALLKEGDRLSWLGNWYAARPLYSAAEQSCRRLHDQQNGTHARLGRIRSQASYRPLNQTFAELKQELSRPEVVHDPRLRMWALTLLASLRIDTNSKRAKSEWMTSLQIAEQLGEAEWGARAKGELGVIAFLDGNTSKAVDLLGGALLSAYRSGDKASQIRLLSLLGLGFNEEHRFSEALTIFKTAIATAERTPNAGFPFLAYRGEAAALAGLNQISPAKQLLTKALAIAREQDDRVHEADLLAEAARIGITDHDLKEAETDFRKAVTIAERMNDYRTVSEIMFDLSEVERQLGDLPSADRALNTGLAASRHLGDRYYLPRDLNALAQIKVAEKKYREADKFYGRAEDVLDDILANQHSFEENTAHAGSMSSIYLEHFRLAQRMG